MDTLDVLTAPINGPLLIEASAGTGKTYSLMHLILRLIVERGFQVDRILIVTFTKNATSELKTRLYGKLQEVRSILADLDNISERLDKLEDSTLREQIKKWLAGKNAEEKEKIRMDVDNAILHLEDASIFTIHSFCQRMLKRYAFSSKNDFDLENVDTSALEKKAIDTVVRREAKNIKDDVERKNFLSYKDFTAIFKRLRTLSRRFPIDRQITLLIGNEYGLGKALGTDSQKAFTNFIEQSAEELKKLKEDLRVQDFDDLLIQTEENLKESSFIDSISDAYDAVLIDEFQDTDPIQFSIFRTIFLDKPKEDRKSIKKDRPVIFVGDPKQSIYSFRSAELETYFQARSMISSAAKLDTNYRSTPTLIEAANTIFKDKGDNKSFLNPNLSYTPIQSTASRLPLFRKLKDGTFEPLPPLEIWTEPPHENSPSVVRKARENALIAEDIANLLNDDVYVSAGNELRPLRPSDITIIVRKWSDAEGIKAELIKRQIRYLSGEQNNVLESEEANEIVQVLMAMENPKSVVAMNRARSTRIIGENLKSILENEKALLSAREVLDNASKIFATSGILAAFKEIFLKFETEIRVLKQLGGDRRLTNYQHILELLHAQNRKVKTLSALIRWMENSQSSEEDRILRRESDADLVRIESIHKSKGLEYPVVYMPKASYQPAGSTAQTIQRLKGTGELTQYLIKIGEGFDSDLEMPASTTKAELDREEAIRNFYVAFTRASSRLVLPLFVNKNKTPFKNSEYFPINGKNLKSPVFQILSGKEAPTAAEIHQVLYQALPQELAQLDMKLKEGVVGTDLEKQLNPDALSNPNPLKFRLVSIKDSVPETIWQDATRSAPSLEAAPPNPRSIPWIRSSFTGLTRNIESTVENQAFDEDTSDDPEDMAQVLVSPNRLEDEKILNFRGNVPAVRYGNFLHELLAEIDFGLAKDPEANHGKILDQVEEKLLMQGIQKQNDEKFDEHALYIADMILQILRTKAFKSMPEFMLCDLKKENKVPEMEFLISVGTPASNRKKLTAKEFGEMLETLDPSYKGFVFNEKDMTGFLTGSIDLAFQANGKFWIIDWKSNYLSDYLNEYQGSYLNEAMDKKHYKLQFLIYLVALKRYLETRLKIPNGYDLIGGAAYFFLRGVREDKPGNGIYFERPHNAVINCIDDALRKGYSKDAVLQYKREIEKGNHA